MKFDDVMDLKEASERYKMNMYTLKSICQKGLHGLKNGKDFRKSGSGWLITAETMEYLSKTVKRRNGRS